MTLSTLKSFFLKYDIWFIFALVFMNFAHNVKFDFLLLIDTLISYIDGFDDGSFTRTDLSGFSLIMLILSIITISLITHVF